MAEAARKAKAEESASSAATVTRASEPARATIARAALDGRRSTLLSPKSIQPSLRVSQPSDAAEVEADRVAKAVVSMPDPTPSVSPRGAPAISRKAAPAAKAKGAEATDAKVEAEVRAAASGGTPLPMKTRKLLEPRFRANFAGVRIHTDGNAAKLANKLNARAFAFGNHIFFGGGAYDPNSKAGLELLAHELTHTIQQGESIQRKADTSETRVSERTPQQASRLGLSDALDFFADAANAIPGYRMFTILIGVNPINMSAVEASAANILRAIVEFLPGGNIITRVLDSYGIFDKVGGWIEGQLKSLGISGPSIKAALDKFMESLSWKDIFNLGGVWDRAKAIFTGPIGKIISFAKSLFSEILRMVREAVLRPLAALAEGSAGYPLLKVILGFDPVTGEAVQPTADAVIGGLMTLIGQDELWANIKKANAVSRAWTWFKGAMGGLKALVTSIPGRFMAALKGLEIMDFVVLPSAFIKLAKVFGNFMGDFGSWALGTVLDLLKIIVEVVAPGVMPYIAKAGAAFNKILKNPVGFVQTLVRAAMQGFRQFAGNFLTHLKASLVGWLTGAMSGAGVYIPQGFSLREILKFVLSVLGLTWANIRGKLVKATSEEVVKTLETGFDIVKTLVTEGPAAAWQKILESLTNLKEMVIQQVMDFVKSKVVEAAVTKLLSMLSPAGALIQAIIAIYNTVMFFVERLKQIAAVAASFIDSLATIAAGNVGPAANRVEQTMAGLLTLVISFLARIAGLGKVSDAVVKLVAKVRAPIDKGLDKVVAWIVTQAKKLGKMVAQAGVPADPQKRLQLAVKAAQMLVKGRKGGGPLSESLLNGLFDAIKLRYGLTALVAYKQGKKWFVRATINPTLNGELTEEETADLLKTVREYTDAELAKHKTDAPRQGAGTHDSPIIVPAGGIAAVGQQVRQSQAELGQGKKHILDVGQQDAGIELRGGIQRPGFPTGGDFNASGATRSELKVPVGDYPAVAQKLKDTFPDERVAAQEMKDFLAGGPIPEKLKGNPGWAGGIKTLAGGEVARDSVALFTLPANLTLVAAGKANMQQVLVSGGMFPERDGRTGGRFSHSPVGAVANLRGVRAELALPITGTAQSKGDTAMRTGIKKADTETIVQLAMHRLGTKANPPLEQIKAVVKVEVETFIQKKKP